MWFPVVDLFSRPKGDTASLQMLTRYRAWAVDLTLRHLTRVPTEELLKPRLTTFGSILDTIAHIKIVDEIFRAHLEGRAHGYSSRRSDDAVVLQDIQLALQDIGSWMIDTSDRLSSSELARRVTYRSVDGEQNEMTVEQILHHLINHAVYHLGYVSDMMYQIPAEPPTTDLTVFVRDIWNRQ